MCRRCHPQPTYVNIGRRCHYAPPRCFRGASSCRLAADHSLLMTCPKSPRRAHSLAAMPTILWSVQIFPRRLLLQLGRNMWTTCAIWPVRNRRGALTAWPQCQAYSSYGPPEIAAARPQLGRNANHTLRMACPKSPRRAHSLAAIPTILWSAQNFPRRPAVDASAANSRGGHAGATASPQLRMRNRYAQPKRRVFYTSLWPRPRFRTASPNAPRALSITVPKAPRFRTASPQKAAVSHRFSPKHALFRPKRRDLTPLRQPSRKRDDFCYNPSRHPGGYGPSF